MWDNNDDDEEEESMFSVKPKGKAPGLPPPPVPSQQKKPATLFMGFL
jgi:hypothetical protein